MKSFLCKEEFEPNIFAIWEISNDAIRLIYASDKINRWSDYISEYDVALWSWNDVKNGEARWDILTEEEAFIKML